MAAAAAARSRPVCSAKSSRARRGIVPPQLLVGIETSDDAAVYQINDEQALIATTDFFMPIVDDPYDFGRIAATNAISDVYAMGGTPIMALALLAHAGQPAAARSDPPHRRGRARTSAPPPASRLRAGTRSTRSSRSTASLRSASCTRRESRRTRAPSAGDVLVLGKPLGVGIYSAALKKDALDAAGYAQMIASTTKLNTPGRRLSEMDAVHALTDVTGFGLLGHLNEICARQRTRRTVARPRHPAAARRRPARGRRATSPAPPAATGPATASM